MLFKLLTALAIWTASYLAWPVTTAIQIQRALHGGDAESLERLVDWESLRADLKERYAIAPAQPARGRVRWGASEPAAGSLRATLAGMIIDRKITSAGLVKALSPSVHRSAFARLVRYAVGNPLGFRPRRLVEATLVTLSRFEIRLDDPEVAGRSLTAVLELDNRGWLLTRALIDRAETEPLTAPMPVAADAATIPSPAAGSPVPLLRLYPLL